MMSISDVDERMIDWDWYACDLRGCIGHFTSAGLRLLPRTVKADRDRAEKLIRFFTGLDRASAYVVRDGVEADAGGWESSARREQYLKSFVATGSRGLFSYDTQMLHSRSASYYLVVRPERPLTIDELPLEVQSLIQITRMPLVFADSPYITEATTLDW
jgi:hypothetical protein